MTKRNVLEKSKQFATEVVKVCKEVAETQKEWSITDQLKRSVTSIGANVCEASYAFSNADFIYKLQIALKECRETEYWLEILTNAGYVAESEGQKFVAECGSIRRMLISSLNTAKARQGETD